MFDYSQLELAVKSLDDAIAAYDNSLDLPDSMREVVRDGVIQRFEYTFELSWKLLKRFFEIYGLEQVDHFTNRQLFRVGFEQGLIGDIERWIEYLHARNQTSHVYQNEVAETVFAIARHFSSDVKELVEQFRERVK